MGSDMDNTAQMLPCPFCGSPGVAVVGSFVRCGSCGAAGPFGNSEAEAVERWNVRVGIVQRGRADDAPLTPGVNTEPSDD